MNIPHLRTRLLRTDSEPRAKLREYAEVLEFRSGWSIRSHTDKHLYKCLRRPSSRPNREKGDLVPDRRGAADVV